MEKTLRAIRYIVIMLLCGNFFAACLDDQETTDVTIDNDLILSNITFGTLPRILHTTNKAGGDTIVHTTLAAGTLCLFSIDQVNNVAYNLDSLPHGIQADKILFSKFTVSGGMAAVKSLTTDKDTLYFTTDTLDFSRGYRDFTLYGNDGTSRRTYRVEVRIHQQKPDSLTWTQYPKDSWESQDIALGNTSNTFSAAGKTFRLEGGVMQTLDTESTEYVNDAIDSNEAQYLPTANLAWVSSPTTVSKNITEVLLYGTRTEADTLTGVIWRRHIDVSNVVATAWEYFPPSPYSQYPVPAVHSATLLSYDNGILLVGINNDDTICLKYSIDHGRTWKSHNYLVLSKELTTRKVTTLKAGVDSHSNLWLLIDDNEVWRGRAHSVDWATTSRTFEE